MKEELTQFKKNIISWYPIKQGSKVLQVGKDEEIFNELKLKTDNVILVSNINELETQNTFDYVTLIGNLDSINSAEEIESVLNTSKKLLNENGKILIAMENKFGMKYWSGQKPAENLDAFDSLLNKKYISINKMKNILSSLNLKYKFYYPLPDYKLTNVIFTDENLPNKDSIDARDLTFANDDELILFSEREAYKQLVEECKEMFPFFANSFFIEVSEKESFEEIKYVSYGISRNKKFRIKTIINKNYVYKYPNNEESKQHILEMSRNIDVLKECNINTLDSYEDGKIISKYLEDAKSFNQVLLEEYNSNGLEATIEKIKEFKENILDKLLINGKTAGKDIFEKYNINIPENLKNKLHYTSNGVIDLIFQNCLLKDEELYIYDQEWFEENTPIEFILYRDILYFTELKEFEDINIVYKKLELEEYLDYFEKLESKIQEGIVDNEVWSLHINSIKGFGGAKNFIENYENQITSINNHVKELEDVIEKYQNSIEELTNSIKGKDVQLENYANELRNIANSLSWKITKPIRQISSTLRKKK